MFLQNNKISKPNQATDSKTSIINSVLAGGGAGAFTRAVAQPLDVLKTRFQLQLEPISQGSKYSSMLQAISSIIREEGLATLWSGHVPAQLLSITYGVLQFGTFEALTQTCHQVDPRYYEANKPWINFSNGAVSATIATIVSFPFDTVRTRLIAEEKTRKAYKGFLNAISSMLKTEGSLALYKGLIPTLGQIAPHAGIQFALYKLFSDSIFKSIPYLQRKSTLTPESSLLGNLLAGSISGFVAKTAIYPFDVVKKRLQIQGFQQYRTSFGRQMYCNGSLHCIRLTVTQEGFFALYKGYWPSIMKAALVSALHFAVYEEIKHLLK